jgi:hypothetical protein
MHNYKLLIGVVFNTNLCQHHAKIFISFKPEALFHGTGFNSLPRGINTLYRSILLITVCIGDFGLDFEFERYLYRSGIPLPLSSGKNIPVSIKNPGYQ